MNLLAIDLTFRDPSELNDIVRDLWAERPVPNDYGDEVTYNRDLELWYDEMQELGEALEEASELEQELNSIGSL